MSSSPGSSISCGIGALPVGLSDHGFSCNGPVEVTSQRGREPAQSNGGLVATAGSLAAFHERRFGPIPTLAKDLPLEKNGLLVLARPRSRVGRVLTDSSLSTGKALAVLGLRA